MIAFGLPKITKIPAAKPALIPGRVRWLFSPRLRSPLKIRKVPIITNINVAENRRSTITPSTSLTSQLTPKIASIGHTASPTATPKTSGQPLGAPDIDRARRHPYSPGVETNQHCQSVKANPQN